MKFHWFHNHEAKVSRKSIPVHRKSWQLAWQAHCNHSAVFSSASSANTITGQKLYVYVSVCVLTRVAQIRTTKHGDLCSYVHRPDKFWSQTQSYRSVWLLYHCRHIALLYGDILTDNYFVLSQSTGLTGRRTNRIAIALSCVRCTSF